jgi:hypothetical protein
MLLRLPVVTLGEAQINELVSQFKLAILFAELNPRS